MAHPRHPVQALPGRASQNKIWSIQYVRALASIIVVVWHTGWSRTVLGQSGVDLFFVVSGFVMMLVSGREDSPGRFALARLARIVPLYWAVTMLVALLDRPPQGRLLTSLLFWPDGPFPVVIQGWSLNLEMSYYLLFALTLFAPVRWRLGVLASEMIVLCVVLPLVGPVGDPVTAWSNPLALEFLAGALLYVLWRAGWLPVGLSAWVIGGAGVVVLVATHWMGGGLIGWVRVAFWGVPAVAIVGAGLGIEQSGQLPRIPLLAELGEASYSIYLTHLLVLRVVAGFVVSLWAPVAVLIMVVIACAFGWVVHRLFERPLHQWTSAWIRRAWPNGQPRPA